MTRILKNLPLFVLVAAIGVALTGCSSKYPPKDEVTKRFLSEIPPFLSVEKTEVDFIPKDQYEVDCKVSIRVSAKEDLFKRVTPEELSVSTLLLPSFIEKGPDYPLNQAKLTELSNMQSQHVFLEVVSKANEPFMIYGRISAAGKPDMWSWGPALVEEYVAASARPRSSFGANAVIVGTDEAKKAFEAIVQRLADLDAAEQKKEETERNAKQQRAQLEERRKQDAHKSFLGSVKEGTVFNGMAQSYGQTEPIEMKVTACNQETSIIKVRFRSLLEEKASRTYTGTFDLDAALDPKKPALHLVGEHPDPDIGSRAQLYPVQQLFAQQNKSLTLFLTSDGFSGGDGPSIKLTKKQ